MRFLPVLFLFLSSALHGQINVNNYIFRGKQAIVNNQYPDAIELLSEVIQVRPEMHEPYFLRAIAKYNLGDFKGAETDLTRSLDIKPNFPDALMYRGVTRQRMLNFSAAIQDFDRALHIDAFNDEVLTSKAFARTVQGKYDDAIELCNKAIEINKQNERAYVTRAWCKYQIYDLEGAESDYSQALKINKFNSETYTKRGVVRAFQLKYSDALNDLNHALSLDSLNLHTLYQLAYVHKELENFDDALNFYSAMITVDPESAVAYFDRAQLHADLGDTDLAVSDYSMVIVVTGGHLLTYFNRGTLYLQQGRNPEAIEDLSKAIELYPEMAEAYYNRAVGFARMGMQAKASADMERAKGIKTELYALDESGKQKALAKMKELSRINEDFEGSSGRFGRVQNKRTRIAPASDFFVLPKKWVPDSLANKAFHIAPVAAKSGKNLSWVVISHKGWKPERADSLRVSLNAQLLSDPGNVEVLLQQGVLFQLSENYDLALEVYDAALEGAPNHPQALLNRAYVLSKMLILYDAYDQSTSLGQLKSEDQNEIKNNFDQIVTSLEESIAEHPTFYPTRFNLANLHAAAGNHSEAVGLYQNIINEASGAQFAPVHFNLGLTLLYLKREAEACRHLSISGELGQVAAYRVIKKFCRP